MLINLPVIYDSQHLLVNKFSTCCFVTTSHRCSEACINVHYLYQALRLSKAAMSQTTVGQMVNLLSNDVNRCDSSVIFLNYLWIGPLQVMTNFAEL